MLTMDAPDHTRYRSLVNRGFTPRMINVLGTHIREMVTKILDPALEKRDCDFVTDVAAELPLQVIAEMLGVPFEDRHKLFEWSNRMIGSKDPEYAVSQEKVQQAAIEMYMYSNELAKQRREEPRDDIVTALLKADLDGDKLSEMDFNVFFLLLAVAGNETTRNAMSHGMHALIEHPEQFAMLAENPVAGAVGDRGNPALGVAGDVLSPQRYQRHGVARTKNQGGRQGQHLVHLGQSRRGNFSRPVHVRHQAHAQPARGVRRRRSALLPRREPRPNGNEHPVRRAGQAGRDQSSAPDRSSACAPTSSTA